MVLADEWKPIALISLVMLPVGLCNVGDSILYVADVYAVVFGSYAFFKWLLGRMDFLRLLLLAVAVTATGAELGLDLYNNIGFTWLIRGFARNTVFLAVIIASVALISRFGVGLWLVVVTSAYVSVAFWGIVQEYNLGYDVGYFLKFRWGGYLAIPILYLFRKNYYWQALFLLAGAATLWLFDVRSFSAIWFSAAVLCLMCKFSIAWRRFTVIIGLACFVWVAMVLVNPTHFVEARTEDRQEASNSQRMHMAQDTWERYLERTITGYGSWQHAATYQDDYLFLTSKNTGVHSWVLQLAFEYGVLGIIAGIALLSILCYSVYIILLDRSVSRIIFSDALVSPAMLFLLLTEGVYVLGCSPFAGVGRIFEGFAVGVALWVIKLKTQRTTITLPN